MKKQNVRTLSFIVSTFTYLLIGAAIFDALESQTEESIRLDLENVELDYKMRYNISNEDYKTLEDIVIKYHPYRTFPQWKFTGAFYFSLTVITTIGYGYSTPQTVLGKIFCMLYAIIGIPLCLVMFQSVGERLNYFASFCIQLFKKCTRLKNTEVNQTEMVCAAVVFAIVVITGGAAMFSHYEGWSYFDSIYYCVITLTTIGFGDFVALQDKNNLSNTMYVILSFTFILFGLTVVASSINLFVLKFLTMNTDDQRREYKRKSQEKNAEDKVRLSTGDLINVVNGNVICTYEPNDIEELKKENTFKFCLSNGDSGAGGATTFLGSLFNKHFKCVRYLNGMKKKNDDYVCEHIAEFNDISNNKKMVNNMNSQHFEYMKPLANENDIVSVRNYVDDKSKEIVKIKTTCSNCNQSKKKKSHYTIRRGPTKISHLLMPNGGRNDKNGNGNGGLTDLLTDSTPTTSSEAIKSSFNKIDENIRDIKAENSKATSSNEHNISFSINQYIDDDPKD